MEYIVVIPAYNEERFIGDTLQSFVDQTLQPKELIVVNDGSTDRTEEIIQSFSDEHSWIRLVNNKIKAGHAPGAKVINAFYVGYDTIDISYDVIVKFDADLIIPTDYFEQIIGLFKAEPKVGMAGGILMIEENGEWVYEDYADKDHIRGAFKAYHKACLDDIGGIPRSIGWDSVDELLAKFHGWETKTIKDLYVKHFRSTGTETGFVKVKVKLGRAFYRIRYGFWVSLISAIKAGFLNKPYILTGIAVMIGWFKALLEGDKFIVSKEEGAFIRKYRKERMLEKLKNLF